MVTPNGAIGPVALSLVEGELRSEPAHVPAPSHRMGVARVYSKDSVVNKNHKHAIHSHVEVGGNSFLIVGLGS